MSIDPNLLILILPGVFGVVLVALMFAPGVRRRALISLLIAVFMAPGLVVGHGIGISLALRQLLPSLEGYRQPADLGLELAFALVPMLVVWIVAFEMGSLGAFVLRSRTSPQPATDSRVRRERWIVFSSYAAFAALVVASVSCRVYAREFLATYGPIVVTIDTGSRSLKDIVVHLTCYPYPSYAGEALLESGKPYEFPRMYVPDLQTPTDCQVQVVHPDLAPNVWVEYPAMKLTPRTRIELPAVSAPPWTDARYQRIARGEEIPPGSNDVPPLRRAEIALYDEWIKLSLQWVPAFCQRDFARIQKEYLPSLAARRNALFLSQGAGPPPDDAADIVLAGWKSSCGYEAQHPQM